MEFKSKIKITQAVPGQVLKDGNVVDDMESLICKMLVKERK
jgi:hypothetical protein